MGIEFFTGSEGGVSNNLVYKILIHRLFKRVYGKTARLKMTVVKNHEVYS